MDPRRFDAATRALAQGSRPASRRRFLAALPALAAAIAAPRLVRALDAGVVQTTPAPGQTGCTGAADCLVGQVCLNGICSSLTPVGGAAETPAPLATTAPLGTTAPVDGALTPTPRAIDAPGAETPAAEPTPAAVGGPIAADQLLPTAIYRGTCGQLGADAAFPLIEVGSPQVSVAPELPEGAPSVEGADFSSSIVSTTVGDLLAESFAIDVRTDADDPATSIACGNVTGTPTNAEQPELVIPLDEQNASGASGVGLIREENGSRSLVYVFISRPDEAEAAGGTTETAQTAETPEAAAGFRRGDRIVTLADVNLRAAPSTEAAVVEVLGAGVELEVTVDERDGWVPVLEPAGGNRGFVAAENVGPADAA